MLHCQRLGVDAISLCLLLSSADLLVGKLHVLDIGTVDLQPCWHVIFASGEAEVREAALFAAFCMLAVCT